MQNIGHMTEAARLTSISRIDAFKASVKGIGKRLTFAKPDIHVTKAGVVKGVAGGVGGGLLVGGELVAGCAPAATIPNPTSIDTAHQTPITIVSPTPAMPSEKAFKTQLVESSTPTATVETTPFALPPVDSIINPSPSEIPQTPITPQQLRDAVAALEAIPNSGLSATDVTQLNTQLQYCTDSATPAATRIQACEGLMVLAYTKAKIMTSQSAQQASYQVAFDTYWEAIGAYGIGPSAKSELNLILQSLK